VPRYYVALISRTDGDLAQTMAAVADEAEAGTA
jgi:hypothetical protein